MTVLAIRYDTPAATAAGARAGSRFVRASRRSSQMDESRTMEITMLRERLERDDYEVDPHKVADAIVERLLTLRRTERPRQCS